MIDYWSYARQNNKTYDPNTTVAITLSDLLACAKEQGTTFKYGDILIVRSGFVDNYNKLSIDQRNAMTKETIYDYEFVGVEATQEMADWLYDNYFAAVAGDQPAFEAWPPKPELVHHTNLLPLWVSNQRA